MQKGLMIAVVVIFVVSIVVSAVSLSGLSPVPEDQRISTTINTRQEELAIDPLTGQSSLRKSGSLEGVIRRLEPGEATEGTHVLTAAGINLSILEAKTGVNLDQYIGRNVEVTGISRVTQTGDGSIMMVEKVVQR